MLTVPSVPLPATAALLLSKVEGLLGGGLAGSCGLLPAGGELREPPGAGKAAGEGGVPKVGEAPGAEEGPEEGDTAGETAGAVEGATEGALPGPGTMTPVAGALSPVGLCRQKGGDGWE